MHSPKKDKSRYLIPFLTNQELIKVENHYFENQKNKTKTAEALMDKVALQIYNAIKKLLKPKKSDSYHFVLLIGKGNNSADAYQTAKHFIKKNSTYEEYLCEDTSKFSPLCLKKRQELLKIQNAKANKFAEKCNKKIVILDGLLGISAKGELRKNYIKAVEYSNYLKNHKNATVFAIDLPSGISGQNPKNTIKADYTLTIAYPKIHLLKENFTNNVSKIVTLPLSELNAEESNNNLPLFTSSFFVKNKHYKLDFNTHKGKIGRIGIVSGSKIYPGSAILTSKSALNAGAGLIYSYVIQEEAHPIIASKLPPEIICKPLEKISQLLQENLDIIIIGPGLDNSLENLPEYDFENWLTNEKRPTIFDADGLNYIAKFKLLEKINSASFPSLITPHIGEMNRLLKNNFKNDDFSKLKWAQNFTNTYQNIILHLKSERSITSTYGSQIVVNSTGTPAMATPGIGDLLCGLVASFAIKQIKLKNECPKIALSNSAIISAYLCCLTAELLSKKRKNTLESITASKIIDYFPSTYKKILNNKIL